MQNTYETLLDLAEKEACVRGFSAVSYGDLAKLAGIRKASIHHHFPAKSDLGAAMLDRHGDRLSGELTALSARSRSGGDALRAYLARSRAELREGNAAGLLASLVADAPRLPETMYEPLARLRKVVIQWLSRTMQRGRQDRSISVSGNPEEEGFAVFTQLMGAQLAARSAREPALYDAASATISARIFRS